MPRAMIPLSAYHFINPFTVLLVRVLRPFSSTVAAVSDKADLTNRNVTFELRYELNDLCEDSEKYKITFRPSITIWRLLMTCVGLEATMLCSQHIQIDLNHTESLLISLNYRSLSFDLLVTRQQTAANAISIWITRTRTLLIKCHWWNYCSK